jgi:hypothetical protein
MNRLERTGADIAWSLASDDGRGNESNGKSADPA